MRWLILMLLLVAVPLVTPPASAADLAGDFKNPPAAARPWTYWFWINGNLTREGITADLEAMARVGIGGVLIMEVARPGGMAPAGPVAFASPPWRELFKFAVTEAARLGLQVNMNNDAGWCGSGGPWVTPEDSMQQLVWTATTVNGPGRFEGVLPAPQGRALQRDYYRDIKVLAWPAFAGESALNAAHAAIPLSPKKAARKAKAAQKAKAAPKGKAARKAKEVASPAATPNPGPALAPEQILDLTDRMDATGKLTWDAPAGRWTVLRLGHTSTGRTNRPAPLSGEGLDCDKLNPEPLQRHFDAFIAKLTQDVGPLNGKTFTMTHIDSSEVGTQNWTPRMFEEFRRRSGYDLAPWLAVLAGGRTVGDAERTNRFLWDFRHARAAMYAEYYAGAMQKLAHDHGLKLSIEAYGPSGEFIDPLRYAARTDVPMGEFWIMRWGAWHLESSRLIASAAHALGKPIVGAESFTSMPANDAWTEHPYSVKTTGDWAFCEGINRFIFHRTVMNPWGAALAPGMSFGGFGFHVDRMQTWLEPGRAWLRYVARCQTLLQRGDFVADVCRLVLEGEKYGQSPGMATLPPSYAPLPVGTNFDYLSDEVMMDDLSVRDGRLVTKAGMNWRVLQLPESSAMTPQQARKIRDLVRAGAVVVGPRPERSPSLRDYPQCDEEVRAIAAEVWGDCDGRTIKEHALGTGRVIWSRPLKEVLDETAHGPDFAYTIDPAVSEEAIASPTLGRGPLYGGEPQRLMPTAGLNWIHRRSGGAEVYFVANPQYRAVEALCTFRVKGMQPELWDPATGEIRNLAAFANTPQGTQLPLHFDPAGSVFVVFRAPAVPAWQIARVVRDGEVLFGQGLPTPACLPELWAGDSGVTMLTDTKGRYDLVFADGRKQAVEAIAPPAAQAVAGPWQVRFQAGRGAPERAEFSKLTDWAKHPDEGIRYFSGTATYATQFDWTPPADGRVRWRLDLGEVQVMAEVKLNGRDLGVLWKRPFIVDATDVLRLGRNELEIKVTNLWPNRLIGDERFPDDCTPDGTWLKGSIPAWPEWVLQGKPRPEPRRLTFTTWKYYTKDSPLLPSGLLGPVTLRGEIELKAIGKNSS